MKISRDEFRDITRGFLTDVLSPEVNVIKEQVSPQGRTESGAPQSYHDFATRLDKITVMLEDLTMDYADSQWLAAADHVSLETDLEKLFEDSDRLSMAAMGLAQSMGEI